MNAVNKKANCGNCPYWTDVVRSLTLPSGGSLGICSRFPPPFPSEIVNMEYSGAIENRLGHRVEWSSFPRIDSELVCGEHPDFLGDETAAPVESRPTVELINRPAAFIACSKRITELHKSYFFRPIGNGETYELMASNSVRANLEDWRPGDGTVYVIVEPKEEAQGDAE